MAELRLVLSPQHAEAVDQLLNGDDRSPTRIGFVLVAFPFSVAGEAVNVSFASNANADTMQLVLNETLRVFKEQSEERVPPGKLQ